MEKKKTTLNWQWVFGLTLVVTGGLFLADQFLEVEIMRHYWPLLIVFFGLMFLVAMAVSGKKAAWLAIPACILVTLGLLFFVQNTYNLWATWTYAWGLLISAIGLGMLIMNAYYKKIGLRRGAGVVIILGLLAFVISGIVFQIIIKMTGMNLESGIFLGSGVVLLGLVVIFSGPIFSKKEAPEPPIPAEEVIVPVEIPVDVAPTPLEEPDQPKELVAEEAPAIIEEPLPWEVPTWVDEPMLEEASDSVDEILPDDHPAVDEETTFDETFNSEDESDQ